MRFAVLLAIVGCGNVDVVGHVGGGAGSSGTGGSGGTSAAICGGAIAERTFRFALCACGQTQVHALRTNVVDAVSGATTRGAAAGVNGPLAPGASANVSGSLWINGDLTLPANSQVDGDLKVTGGLAGGDQSHVARDAWVNGTVNLPWQGLTVSHDLYAPSTSNGISVGGRFHQRSFAMTGPCDCGADAVVDVASAVAAGQQNNDDASIGMAPNRLASVTSNDEISLPAGQFYLDVIGGTAQATIHVSGKTVLMVGGNVQIGQLTIDVGSSGEMDLFIGGSLLTGNVGVGNSQRPAASRIYVAGSQAIEINDFTGNLYAPAAQITSTASPAIVHGALFAGSIMTGDLSIHYDADIGNAGASCGNPSSCTRSQDCVSGSACINGSCSACNTDSDCAAPLICNQSRCTVLRP